MDQVIPRRFVKNAGLNFLPSRGLAARSTPAIQKRNAPNGSALPNRFLVLEIPLSRKSGVIVAKKAKKIVRREYTKADVKELRSHSKAKTPVAQIAKLTKRTEGSLRQKALKLGIRLGHRR
jgi:hypothetical protein